MMVEPLKMNSIILALLLLPACSFSQTLMYCGENIEAGKETMLNECEYFYNFFEAKKDSFPFISGYHYDSLLEAEIPVIHKKKVKIVAQVNPSGVLNGFIEFYKDSSLFQKGNMRNGVANGVFEFDIGEVKKVVVFKNGKKEGMEVIKDENLGLLIERNYSLGLLDGEERVFNKDGLLVHYISYENGVKNGLEISIHDNKMLHYFLQNEKGAPVDGYYYRYNDVGDIYNKIKVENQVIVESKWY